jgi:hypothetical protein
VRADEEIASGRRSIRRWTSKERREGRIESAAILKGRFRLVIEKEEIEAADFQVQDIRAR